MNLIKKTYLPFFILTVSLWGCVSAPKKSPPQMTPLEIQAIQSQEFDESKNIVFSSVVSVFQDLGYNINNANLETGFISAESPLKSYKDHSPRLSFEFFKFFGPFSGTSFSSRYGSHYNHKNRMTQVKATAFIEQLKKSTRVRLNFIHITQTSSSVGQQNRYDHPITDVKLYGRAFEKIQNAIFVRSGPQ